MSDRDEYKRVPVVDLPSQHPQRPTVSWVIRHDDIKARLRRRYVLHSNAHAPVETSEHVNPDGPKGADRIKALEAELARLRGALNEPQPHWPRPVDVYQTSPSRGCICHPTSEQTCKSPICPRRSASGQPFK